MEEGKNLLLEKGNPKMFFLPLWIAKCCCGCSCCGSVQRLKYALWNTKKWDDRMECRIFHEIMKMSWAVQWARPAVLASWLRSKLWEAATDLIQVCRKKWAQGCSQGVIYHYCCWEHWAALCHSCWLRHFRISWIKFRKMLCQEPFWPGVGEKH